MRRNDVAAIRKVSHVSTCLTCLMYHLVYDALHHTVNKVRNSEFQSMRMCINIMSYYIIGQNIYAAINK